METIGSLLRHLTPSVTSPLRNTSEKNSAAESETETRKGLDSQPQSVAGKDETWKNTADFPNLKSGNAENDPLRKFPSYESFKAAYKEDLQTVAVCNPERCFGGGSPTLADVARKYGVVEAQTWVVMQLKKYADDAFNSMKMKKNSLESCAKYICAQYYWLKCSEVLLFLGYCTLGKYDDYVGSKLDIPAVMKALRQFVDQDRANYLYKQQSF